MFAQAPETDSTLRSRSSGLIVLLGRFGIGAFVGLLLLGPRPAEAQWTSTIPRQGIPTTQQGILTKNDDEPMRGSDNLTFTRQGIPTTQQTIPTKNDGEPSRAADDLTAHYRQEGTEGDKNAQIGSKTQIPGSRWVASSQWFFLDIVLQTNEEEEPLEPHQ